MGITVVENIHYINISKVANNSRLENDFTQWHFLKINFQIDVEKLKGQLFALASHMPPTPKQVRVSQFRSLKSNRMIGKKRKKNKQTNCSPKNPALGAKYNQELSRR